MVPVNDNEITPFRLAIPDTELHDLRERLERTRWPEPEPVDDWSQGVPIAYLRELCRYWAREYDWPATQARLNALPQYRTEIARLYRKLLFRDPSVQETAQAFRFIQDVYQAHRSVAGEESSS